MSASYRAQLEAEKNEIMRLLEVRATEGKVRLTRRLREIVTSLNEMDNGENWSQPESDTKARIVLNDIHASHKVIRS